MPIVRIVIEYDTEKGTCNVNGPLQNKIGMCHILNVAQRLAIDYNPEEQKRVLPAVSLPEGLAAPGSDGNVKPEALRLVK
jgi:hypothetical protein